MICKTAKMDNGASEEFIHQVIVLSMADDWYKILGTLVYVALINFCEAYDEVLQKT